MSSYILALVICTVIVLIAFLILTALACIVAIKFINKELVEIIKECEKEDKEQIFLKFWKKHNP